MNKIIKLMGCSGAGKTSAARRLLDETNRLPQIVKNAKDKDEAYFTYQPGILEPVILLGNYRGANCGGMDTVGSATEAIALVAKYAPQGHVVHEGLLQSTYYGAMGSDSRHYGSAYIYALINTPVEVCLSRVVERRRVNGSKNKFQPQLTIEKHGTVRRAWETARKNGHTCVELQWDQPIYPQMMELLK